VASPGRRAFPEIKREGPLTLSREAADARALDACTRDDRLRLIGEAVVSSSPAVPETLTERVVAIGAIRAGSAEGEVMFEGIVDAGRTMRFARPRIWIRLGAAANVDVTVNGARATDLPGGTVDLIATRAGIAPQTA
jgi:hypothetical protein